MRRLLPIIAIALAAAVVTAAVVLYSRSSWSTQPKPSSVPVGAPAGTSRLGVYIGSRKPVQLGNYERWLGQPVRYVLDYVGQMPEDAPDPWMKIDDPSSWCEQWKPANRELVLSVAIVPNQQTSLRAGARGEYDDHWQRFAQVLVDHGCADVTLRLGWEFNGRFFDWAAGGHEAEFAGYWRRIVTAIRRVPGQTFTFDWCPLAGNGGADVEAAYPGDDYVDYIGLDAYDSTSVSGPPDARWDDVVNRQYGLAWQTQFAADRHKPMTLPEWGLSVRTRDDLGGGDDPTYIVNMVEWVVSHHFAYAIYFEADPPDGVHKLANGQFPESAAAYRELAAKLTQ